MIRGIALIAFALMLLTNLTGYTKLSGWVVASPIIAYTVLYIVCLIGAVIYEDRLVKKLRK